MSQELSEFDTHVSRRYEMEKRLGRGAYGIVWKAKSKRSGRVVAVKKIFDAFRNKTDAQRTFREIVFLKAFRGHPNIVQLLNVHKADNNRDLYLVFEYMNTDLQRAIHKKPGMLKDVHRRFIMYQLLSATRFLHKGKVIHRDQKPSNVLLDTDCIVKIADFGLARSLTHLKQQEEPDAAPHPLTDYVATRWYRSPEILIGCKEYTEGIDIWSLGCIMGEMLLRRPLFPGNSTLDQIEMIFRSGVVKDAATLKKFRTTVCLATSEYAVSILNKAIVDRDKSSTLQTDPLNEIRQKSLEEDETADEAAADLVQKLLQVIPATRITADQAIRHKYVAKFYNPSVEERVRSRNVLPPLDDDKQLSIEEYRQKLYEIIQSDKAR